MRQRKLKKQRLREAAERFNASPLKAEWVLFALDLKLLDKAHDDPASAPAPAANNNNNSDNNIGQGPDSAATNKPSSSSPALDSSLGVADAKSVAKFLKNTPGLGKVQVGEFLSRGPVDRYPFHAAVLRAYVDTFDFSGPGSTFVRALRHFLGHFRLPGEAQCIDRLMEAFSRRLYGHLGEGRPFASHDAAFILAFSTIMLNTDLHNPNLPPSKKMTKEQFVRNNRGINDGADLPLSYLEELYEEIKARQIQVDLDIGDYTDASAAAASLTDPGSWRRMLRRAEEQAPASFTPSVAARLHKGGARGSGREGGLLAFAPASVHEREMFLAMASPVLDTSELFFFLLPLLFFPLTLTLTLPLLPLSLFSCSSLQSTACWAAFAPRTICSRGASSRPLLTTRACVCLWGCTPPSPPSSKRCA